MRIILGLWSASMITGLFFWGSGYELYAFFGSLIFYRAACEAWDNTSSERKWHTADSRIDKIAKAVSLNLRARWIAPNLKSFLAIDPSQKKLVIGELSDTKKRKSNWDVLHCSDILSCDILLDGNPITHYANNSSGPTVSVGVGAIGSRLGVGISASESRRRFSRGEVLITTNDLIKTNRKFQFFSGVISESDDNFQILMDQAREWCAKINVLRSS